MKTILNLFLSVCLSTICSSQSKYGPSSTILDTITIINGDTLSGSYKMQNIANSRFSEYLIVNDHNHPRHPIIQIKGEFKNNEPSGKWYYWTRYSRYSTCDMWELVYSDFAYSIEYKIDSIQITHPNAYTELYSLDSSFYFLKSIQYDDSLVTFCYNDSCYISSEIHHNLRGSFARAKLLRLILMVREYDHDIYHYLNSIIE